MSLLNTQFNPYIDEVPSSAYASSAFSGAKLDPRTQINTADKAGFEKDYRPSDSRELQESAILRDNTETADDRNPYLDEFSKAEILTKQANRLVGDPEQERKKQQRKIERKRSIRVDGQDLDTDELKGFFYYLDRLWKKLSDFIEESLNDFANWNKWFKTPSKKKPPAPSAIKPLYVREEFKMQRSPHMWKSDPKKTWILTFGDPGAVNNKVAEVLYKYQNNTISKDA